MLQLIMDTSNQYLMVALYEDDQCLEAIIKNYWMLMKWLLPLDRVLIPVKEWL